VRSEIPTGVSHIHFRADLSGVMAEHLTDLSALGSELRLLLPNPA
jgi:hypothetical protein